MTFLLGTSSASWITIIARIKVSRAVEIYNGGLYRVCHMSVNESLQTPLAMMRQPDGHKKNPLRHTTLTGHTGILLT